MKMTLFSKLTFMFCCVVVLAACQSVKHYSISEHMIDHYLHSEQDRHIQYSNGLKKMALDLALECVDIEIGRNQAKSITAHCLAKIIMYSSHHQKSLHMNLTFSGKPELKSDKRGVYLATVAVDNYRIAPSKEDHDAEQVVDHLNPLVQAYFQAYPIYLLDPDSFLENQALTAPSSFVVDKGKLQFAL